MLSAFPFSPSLYQPIHPQSPTSVSPLHFRVSRITYSSLYHHILTVQLAYIIPTYDEMNKIFNKAEQGLVGNVVSKKLTNVSVSRGKTAWPKAEKDLTNFGIRFDFDGEVTQNGVVYNKFQVQPNAGKVPSSVQQWRENNGGTHAVMGSMLVKKGGTKDDVKQAFSQFQDAFKK